MSRTKKTCVAGAVLLVVEFLCLGAFNSRSFGCSEPHITARSGATTASEATPVLLKSAKRDDSSVAVDDGDATCPGFFSAPSERWQLLIPYLSVPVLSSQHQVPKVSRYISNSVLIL